MSGFFSLGGNNNNNKDHHDQHHHHPTDNNNSLFLFKGNEEIYNKGFELWQQYYHLHHQRHAHTPEVDFSVGPSRTINNNNNRNIISIVNTGDDQCSSYSDYDRSGAGFRVMRRGGNEGVNCQDCGNQAKKDCAHLRCRTCCKSRGFHCQTHVKSTWVPAAKRRERQLAAADHQAVRGETTKRQRESPAAPGALACAGTRLPAAAAASGFEVGHFPPEVNSPAVFRCVRVSAVDEADEHFAYQTAVNIGGHVFKGILYDQGPENRYGGESSTQQQPLDLIAASSSAAATGNNQSMTMIDPSIYPTPLNAFMAGTQFFPPPRP